MNVAMYRPKCTDCGQEGPNLPELADDQGNVKPHVGFVHAGSEHVIIAESGERIRWVPSKAG